MEQVAGIILKHMKENVLCNDNELGDEYHYIFVCDKFKNERNLLLPKYFAKPHNMLKFNEILNWKNRKTLNNFSRFINIVINSCKLQVKLFNYVFIHLCIPHLSHMRGI